MSSDIVYLRQDLGLASLGDKIDSSVAEIAGYATAVASVLVNVNSGNVIPLNRIVQRLAPEQYSTIVSGIYRSLPAYIACKVVKVRSC